MLEACLGFCVTLGAVLPGLPYLPKYSVVAMQGTYFGIQKMLSAGAWGAGGCLCKVEESTHLWGGSPVAHPAGLDPPAPVQAEHTPGEQPEPAPASWPPFTPRVTAASLAHADREGPATGSGVCRSTEVMPLG